jgi:dipeptidyl aminopeptidase/acylaminoacyl peptidase
MIVHIVESDTSGEATPPRIKDIRGTALYREAEALFKVLRQPGTGQISDAAELHAAPDGKRGLFAGTLMDRLEGAPSTRVCSIDFESTDVRVLTFGPNTDRSPRYSPDGRRAAFLSDRLRAGDFQLYLLDPVRGVARDTPPVDGWVEYLQWSPDGSRILLGVAGRGADTAGAQGAVTSRRASQELPSWMPGVQSGDEDFQWRRAWVYEIATNTVRQVSKADQNIWEAAWCGNDTIVAVASPGSSEGLWYSAGLRLIDVSTGQSRERYAPGDQLGVLAASPSGRIISVVEAICSDRWVVAGNLRLIDTASGSLRHVDTRGIDVAHLEWRSDRHLLLAGHRGFETVVALYDAISGALTEVWSSEDLTSGGRYVSVAGFGESGDCVMVGESFLRAPEIAVIHRNEYRAVKSFDLGYTECIKAIGAVERVTWQAPDGLDIQGWLLRPTHAGPYPVIMQVHGGPVAHWRPRWLGRANGMTLMLLRRGYAIFWPNPRGSSGRGQDFARRVVGDMGGADTHDFLAGLDHLVASGVADPERLGVTGVSYGGFMTSWLITQDARFAAAVSVSPITHHVTEQLLSNIPRFTSLFLADHYRNVGGKYYQRSPLMHAHKVATPTLNICGALDRCTPAQEAVQFHNALLENGTTSVLITYPEEGHGVRRFPAVIDFTARAVEWFEHYLGCGR